MYYKNEVCVCAGLSAIRGPTCVVRILRCAAGVLAYEETEEPVLMSSVSMLSLTPLLTELLSSQLDTHKHTQRKRLTLMLLRQ